MLNCATYAKLQNWEISIFYGYKVEQCHEKNINILKERSEFQ